MEVKREILENSKIYKIGRITFNDEVFKLEKPPPKIAIFDYGDESLHHEFIETPCNVPGCKYVADTILAFENHYNASHRHVCSQCKKLLPSPHLLDLHILENHDSFFAVMSERKPSFSCYVEECQEKFLNAEERLDHCVKIHRYPKNFRFAQKRKGNKKKNQKTANSMELDIESATSSKKFEFNNSKQKVFSKYSGRKFTNNKKLQNASVDVDMKSVIDDLRENLPE